MLLGKFGECRQICLLTQNKISTDLYDGDGDSDVARFYSGGEKTGEEEEGGWCKRNVCCCTRRTKWII